MEWRGVLDSMTLALYYYPTESTFDSLNPPPHHTVDLSQESRVVVFVDGRLALRGEIATQDVELIVGCSANIRLIDDVMIAGTDMVHGTIPGNSSSRLAIASEGDIIIADTWENGRANRTGPMADHADIVITALIFALGGSFTFEDMNDVGDNYIGPVPDERGNIVMTGGVTQSRRGYVHRSNNGGTGYNKVYHYDGRLIRWSVGVFEPFDIEESVTVVELPSTFSVSVFPNPFNATAVLRLNLVKFGRVEARVFDLLGREIATLASGVYPAGEQSIHISGAGWGSGLYFVKVDAEGQSITQKVMLLK
ncbi:MAG: T9SS type A sorting domain-containing protein [bacterium]|nr:T9SS type A sorting domain-containing protein [bacterium]